MEAEETDGTARCVRNGLGAAVPADAQKGILRAAEWFRQYFLHGLPLENIKSLILLDLKILLGADIPWQLPGKQPDPESLAALSQAGAGDDKSESSHDESSAAAATDPAPNAAAPGADAPDPMNFLTWTSENWETVDFSRISFPADQTPLKNKTYYAVAVIFLNLVSVRAKHPAVWDELKAAWLATFSKQLSGETLGPPPFEGPYAFSKEEREWCKGTLPYFGAGGTKSPPLIRRASGRSGAKHEPPAAAAAVGTERRADAAAPTTPYQQKVSDWLRFLTYSRHCVLFQLIEKFAFILIILIILIIY